VPIYARHFEAGQLQFVTSSTYGRAAIFSVPGYCRLFVEAVRAARLKLGFLLVGWVLMAEHFHLLFQPWPAESTPNIMKDLKQRSAHAILEALRAEQDIPSCRTALRSFRLPGTLHDQAHYRVWQRRHFPFSVYAEKKRLENLDSMHNHPVKRGSVASPGEWPRSSWSFYFLGDRSVLEMDPIE
jgi:REP-associated tyrosine transposase